MLSECGRGADQGVGALHPELGREPGRRRTRTSAQPGGARSCCAARCSARGKDSVEIKADTADEVLPLVRELLGGRVGREIDLDQVLTVVRLSALGSRCERGVHGTLL
ncbi:MAG TPA: hypothetical protein VN969_12040 [Streptosporangiaceae bacterium]|nr:hypothetical protein [Streptosporangiaceae bacterium]